jgi:hypothetical protein
MKLRAILILTLLLCSFAAAQHTFEPFDGKWVNLSDLWWSEGSNLTSFTYDSTLKYEGAASLRIEWMNKTYVDWQYAGVSMANYLDATTQINFADYDSLVFYYYVERPAHQNDTYMAIIFIDNPSDLSYASNPTNTNDGIEFWRHQVNNIFTDTVKAWKRYAIPLKEVGDPSNPTVQDWTDGWNRQSLGLVNNKKFDKGHIRGYYLEFDSDSTNTYDSCIVHIDGMMAVGKQVSPFVIFDGRRVPSDIRMATGWSGSVTTTMSQDADSNGTGSVRWNCDDGWDGVWWEIPTLRNLGSSWTNDTLQFKIKAPHGFGRLYVALTDPQTTTPSAYQVVYTLDESYFGAGGYDNNWHLVRLPLSAFEQWGSWDPQHDMSKRMDSSKIAQFRIEGDGQAMTNKVVYFDDIWIGHPTFDVTAPATPSGVAGVTNGNYINTVSWTDDALEVRELYNVYESRSPITDIHAAGVSVSKLGIPKFVGLYDMQLRNPLSEKSVDMYYAVTCVDTAGNESAPGLTAKVTNIARGWPVIAPAAPAGLTVDGDLSEWSSVTPFQMNPWRQWGAVVTNTAITDSNDLSAKAYVAVDNQNLYVAIDVNDDVVCVDTTLTPGWRNDSPELFIGLYDDSKGVFRWNYQRGAEPNYHLEFRKDNLHMTHNLVFDKPLMLPGVNYVWKEKNLLPGYTVEARIPLALLASEGADQLFVPQFGMQIPIDFAVNDADVVGDRQGIMTFSPTNQDNSWAYVTGYWSATWIGGYPTSVQQLNTVPTSYSLLQNFPNPFNPTTEIRYSIAKTGLVTLKVYDILGREVTTLVNQVQDAGSYAVRFGSGLSLASGVYFCQITSGSFRDLKKMMLIK